MTVMIYGIKNCDTMKKALAWLDAQQVGYDFHDYKKHGVTEDQLTRWCKRVGWERLLNKAGTTFRKLEDADKQGIDETKAIALMVANPSMIRRPVLDGGDELLVGFKVIAYQSTFA